MSSADDQWPSTAEHRDIPVIGDRVACGHCGHRDQLFDMVEFGERACMRCFHSWPLPRVGFCEVDVFERQVPLTALSEGALIAVMRREGWGK